MPLKRPTIEQFNVYVDLMLLLNQSYRRGKIDCNSSAYYNFLDTNKITHKQMQKIVTICSGIYDTGKLGSDNLYITYRSERDTKVTDGVFYLTTNGQDIKFNLPTDYFPAKMYEQKITDAMWSKDEQPVSTDYLFELERKKREQLKLKKGDDWSKEELVHLLTREAHIVGRMLGNGYDLLEPIHSEWIYEWIINPKNLSVIIHQAHRNSYKSTCLRLAISILMILQPTLTIILIRKSEDAVKELIGGVSKILETPLFLKFAQILHPDIAGKGGLKKSTDTALIIDTNLNISLSGEPQLRGVGLGSPLTGKHSKMIITDDIVTLDDRESEAERRNTISKYQELINIISTGKGFEGSMILNIGTPWHEEDAFQTMEKGLPDKCELQIKFENIPAKERTDKQNEKIRRANMLRGLFVYNCYQTGLMTAEQIALKKKMLNDDVLFAANYELTLVSDDEKPFPKINNVGNYTADFFKDNAWEVFAAIDGAYGGTDSCSLSIGAMDWDNYTVVVLGKLYTGIALDKNYMELAEIMQNNNAFTLYMETNADKGLMGEKFRELGFNVISYHESMNKHTKIVSTIRPYWREKGEQLMPCVQFVQGTDADYLSQIHNYKKGVKHDDAPDNLACLILKGKFGALAVRVT